MHSDRMMALEVRATLYVVVGLLADAEAGGPGEALHAVRTAVSQLRACEVMLGHLARQAVGLETAAAGPFSSSTGPQRLSL